jgi:hypothetical protein
MKKTILLGAMFLGSFIFAQIKGGDRDAHGCIGSAGYTYSQIKKDCVRVFEQKIKLTEVAPKGSSTSMAAVIFSKDLKKDGYRWRKPDSYKNWEKQNLEKRWICFGSFQKERISA